MARRARPAVPAESKVLPNDDQLLAYITGPMRSYDVAQHFGVDGPTCLQRLAYLLKHGKLSRPYHAFYAPLGDPPERPLPPRYARVVGVLHEPRTAAEIGQLAAVRSVTHVLQSLMQLGHVAHCGKHHYVRFEHAHRFEPRQLVLKAGPRTKEVPPARLKAAILEQLTEHDRTMGQMAQALGQRRDRVSWHVCAMMETGHIRRLVTEPGKPYVYRRLR